MEPLKDSRNSTEKKTVYAHNMVRTDFKEQKLEKFLFDNNKRTNTKEERKPLDVSVTEDEYDKNHDVFLKCVENLEDKMMNKTDNDLMDDDNGDYLIHIASIFFIIITIIIIRYNWSHNRTYPRRSKQENA